MSKLFIVISGQITRENSANLMNFWRGFVNIQNSIYDIDDLTVVSHSWNPEFDDLVKNVYNVDLSLSEVQSNFAKEFMPLIDPIDKFERGLKRSQSTWRFVTPQTILGNLRSRSKAINLLRDFDVGESEQVLAVRWDQGCTGSESVNSIIFDKSLDSSYHYISYYSAVDEGYADMWFVSPYRIAAKFEKLDKYALDALSNKNGYFDSFTRDGWPLSIQRNVSFEFVNKYKKKALGYFLTGSTFDFFKSAFPFAINRIESLERWVGRGLNSPFLSGENSLLINSKTNVTFPNYQALNIHAILKSFIIDNGLREETRFLDTKDFEQSHSGGMINPIEFAYVIYSHSTHSDYWCMAVSQAKECLPGNCKKIYLVSEESEQTFNSFSGFNGDTQVELLTYKKQEKYTDRLVDIFNQVSRQFNFVYFVHEDTPLVGTINQVYLNTLLHYMNNSNEYYIRLVDVECVDKKEDHNSFPGLVKNYGGHAFSIQMSLFKPSFLSKFLSNFNKDAYGLEKTCAESNFRFSAVKGDAKIGRSLLTNTCFPHISKADAKEVVLARRWSQEISFINKKYDIDLTVRDGGIR